MMSLKPWQIGLFALAIVAVGAVAWIAFRPSTAESSLRRSLILVDVTTGELFEYSTKRRPALIPERNPDTGEAMLIPAVEGDAGWEIAPRYLDVLKDMIESKAVPRDRVVVDPGTGRFTPPSTDIRAAN